MMKRNENVYTTADNMERATWIAIQREKQQNFISRPSIAKLSVATLQVEIEVAVCQLRHALCHS